MVDDVLAALEAVRNVIATSVPLNYELNYDGTEDRERAAYVEGLRDAVQIIEEQKELFRNQEGKPT